MQTTRNQENKQDQQARSAPKRQWKTNPKRENEGVQGGRYAPLYLHNGKSRESVHADLRSLHQWDVLVRALNDEHENVLELLHRLIASLSFASSRQHLDQRRAVGFEREEVEGEREAVIAIHAELAAEAEQEACGATTQVNCRRFAQTCACKAYKEGGRTDPLEPPGLSRGVGGSLVRTTSHTSESVA